MSKMFDRIEDTHRTFIEAQPIFFVATNADGGRINLSPKGQDSLRVLGEDRILWMNLTGSGNETAPHLRDDPRMTLMWCSFGKRPMIMRAYGTARAVHPGDADWAEMSGHFAPDPAMRQVFEMAVTSLQTSCGYAVPMAEAMTRRDTLAKWAEDRGPDGIRDYWRTRNTTTIDGKPTGITS